MTTTQTEIALIKKDNEQMATDIQALTADVKAIKNFLMGEDPKVVTRREFDEFKKSNRTSKWVSNIATSVVTAIVTAAIINALK